MNRPPTSPLGRILALTIVGAAICVAVFAAARAVASTSTTGVATEPLAVVLHDSYRVHDGPLEAGQDIPVWTHSAEHPQVLQIDVGCVRGVILNLTVAQADGVGYVTVWPLYGAKPGTSNLNYSPGPPVANSATVRTDLYFTGAGVRVGVELAGVDRMIVDVTGTLVDPECVGGAS